jgi:hypothetical protein
MAIDDDRLQRIEDRIGRMAEDVAKLMPRNEIEAALANRVSMDAHQNVLDRLVKLENAPQKMQAVIALWVAGGTGCLSVGVMLLSIGVAIVLHFWR